MRILIAGGTGTAGRAVASRAAARGHEVVVLSRTGAAAGLPAAAVAVAGDVTDLTTLTGALEGVDVLIDCTNIATQSEKKATEFFTTSVRNLAAGAGLRSYVLLSIVGIDRFPLGYYRAKLAQEQALAAAAAGAGLDFAIVRATQFHDFPGQLLERLRKGRLAAVPDMTSQPVDTTEVAAHLVDVAEQGLTGRAPDIAGPQPESIVDLTRRLVAHRGQRVRVVTLPLPPKAARANKAHALIPDGGVRGTITWAQWLDEQPRFLS